MQYSTKNNTVIDKVISEDYKNLLLEEHRTSRGWGVRKGDLSKGPKVIKIADSINAATILDYGCGKGDLKKYINEHSESYQVFEYDPGIPDKDTLPEPADLVVCFDVMEHVEENFVEQVVDDLWRVTLKLLVVEISSQPAYKILSDGRNAHITQKPGVWWEEKFAKKFSFQLKLINEQASHFFLIPNSKE